MPDEEISPVSKLLRMRRDQQPPPEYFQNFLREFQERQRAELLRRPAWRIALDRTQAYFGDLARNWSVRLAPGQLAYAGASVAVLAIAAVFTAEMLKHPGEGYPPSVAALGNAASIANAVVAASPPQAQAGLQVATVQAAVAPAVTTPHLAYRLSLDPEIRLPDPFPTDASRLSSPVSASQYPRYILDTRPASYEPPLSF